MHQLAQAAFEHCTWVRGSISDRTIRWVDACRAVVAFSAQGISLRTPFPPRPVGDTPLGVSALPNRSGLNRFKMAWRYDKGTQVDCQEGEVETRSAIPRRSNTRLSGLAGRSIGLVPRLVACLQSARDSWPNEVSSLLYCFVIALPFGALQRVS